MRKLHLGAMLAAVAAAAGTAAEPEYYWDFDKTDSHGVIENRGCMKQSVSLRAPCSSGAGVNGSAGLIPDIKKRALAGYFKLDWPSFTLEMKFKLNKEISASGGATLWQYMYHSWKRRVFTLGITGKKELEFDFIKRSDDGKQQLEHFTLKSHPEELIPGKFHTLRVTTASGGSMKLYLDGRLVAAKDKAPGFNDLSGVIPREYPLMFLGIDMRYPDVPQRLFDGVIDDLKIMKGEIPPEESDITATGMTDAKVLQLESTWNSTTPFQVLDKEQTTLGVFHKADDKYTKAAANARVKLDGERLIVEIRCPLPEGIRAEKKGNSIWSGDVAEFFFQPVKGESKYFQYAANINGKSTAYRYKSPGTPDTAWKSAFHSEIREEPGAFIVAFTIPCAEIGLDKIADGDTAGVNFTRCGNSAGGKSTWANVGDDFHNLKGMGTLVYGSYQNYFNRKLAADREKFKHISGDPALKGELNRQFASLESDIAKNAGNTKYFEPLEKRFYNLQSTMTRYALSGKKLLLFQPGVWSNSLEPDLLTVPLKKLKITAFPNSRAIVGIVAANLTSIPYLGQIKAVSKPELPSFSTDSGRPAWLDSIELRRGIPLRDTSGIRLFDPIVELPLGTLFEVPAFDVTPLWVSVNTSKLQPGTYRAFLSAKSSLAEFPNESVELEVEVKDLDLYPERFDSCHYNYITPRYADSQELLKIFTSRDVNYIYLDPPGHIALDIYPPTDREGNLTGPSDYTQIDHVIENYVKAGMPLKRIKLWFFLALDLHYGLRYKGKASPLKFDTPAWNKAYAAWLADFTGHLKLKYGIGPDRIVFYTLDEPNGSVDDPKSKNNFAYRAGKMIKAANPAYRTMINPQLNGNSAELRKTLAKLAECYDTLELYRPRATPELVKFVKTLPYKEFWTYTILGKTTPPDVYRRAYWENLRDGFNSCANFWHCDAHAGGDGFNSFDTFRDGKNRADYGTLFVDFNNKKVATSRRHEAHDQGFIDYQLGTLCRELAKGRPEAEKVEKIISEGAGGDIEAMDAARAKLTEIALELKGKQSAK